MSYELPHHIAAQQYMEHKGLGHFWPYRVEQLDAQDCWYFYYHLNDGDLELEVVFEDESWHSQVTAFKPLH